jgi:hypothetical protein
MIEEGKYRAVGVSTGLGEAKTGTPQIGVMFRVVGGQADGMVVGWRGYFSDKTTQRTIESLRYCGWNGNDLSVFTETNEEECYRLLPSEVEIVVEHEAPTTPDGKAYAKVAWVNKLGTGTVTMKNKLDANRAKAFAESMRGACAAVPASGASSPRKPPGQAQTRPALRSVEPPQGRFDDDDDFPL